MALSRYGWQPHEHKDADHLVTGRYDERGNLIEAAYFDTAGNPTQHKDAYHLVTGRYDERGNRIEWAYFDTAGNPMQHKDGYHRMTGRYDERGNVIERTTSFLPGEVKDGCGRRD